MPLSKLSKPILYSTITKLAYNINKIFYDDTHYMWCTPYFNSPSNTMIAAYTVPPSSCPFHIYNELRGAVSAADKHSMKINQNKIGIRRGATKKFDSGEIDISQKNEIFQMVKLAMPNDFTPYICVMPRIELIPFCKPIPIKNKANVLSYEYVVSNVPSSIIDVISPE